ncbi:MAG: hypothetical protein ABIP74_04850 [Candidatus Saccharimonas sp.]
MVTAFYIFLLAPVIIYLVFSVVEIWLTLKISMRKHSRSLLFIQASTEVTHTILVFAYAQFMVTFSPLLMEIGAQLWWPIALLMASLLLRGSIYLLLFYREHSKRIEYIVLLATYLVGVAALAWFLAILVPAIVSRQFVPDMTNATFTMSVGVPVVLGLIVPLVAVYRHAFAQLRK